MRKLIIVLAGVVVAPLAVNVVAADQLPSIVNKAQQVVKGVNDVILTEDEERQMGADISAQLRERYGVAQDAAVHKYVTLVGTALAQKSSRPNLKWTFIVLDTDGVNAFAAPGGFVHVTRGALALMQTEAELAGVLGHEIGHVTEKHTVNAVMKSKAITAGVGQGTRNELIREATKLGYAKVIENNFDKNEENASDRTGVELANGLGYAPNGLSSFLTRLADRNKDLKEKSGIFASYPATKSRLDEMAKQIKTRKLTAAALVQPRYDQAINYTLVPVSQVAQAAAAAPGASKPASTAKPAASGQYGIGDITKAVGLENSNSGTVASTGSRGVNPDRDAKGGSNRTLVVVSVTAAELETFKKGIS